MAREYHEPASAASDMSTCDIIHCNSGKMAEGDSDAPAPDYLKIIADHREELLAAMKATDWVETKNKVRQYNHVQYYSPSGTFSA